MRTRRTSDCFGDARTSKIETIVFNYDKLFIGNGVTSIPMLQPGDQVIVK